MYILELNNILDHLRVAAKSPVFKKMIKKIDTMPEDYVTIQKDLITCLPYVYSAPQAIVFRKVFQHQYTNQNSTHTHTINFYIITYCTRCVMCESACEAAH